MVILSADEILAAKIYSVEVLFHSSQLRSLPHRAKGAAEEPRRY